MRQHQNVNPTSPLRDQMHRPDSELSRSYLRSIRTSAEQEQAQANARLSKAVASLNRKAPRWGVVR